MCIIAVDAMGGDHAPHEIIKGCMESLDYSGHKLILFGLEKKIKAELEHYKYDESRIEIVNTTEIIETAEAPVEAIRTKTDSSMVLALKAVKSGRADGMVSAGNTGALLAGGQLIVGRIKGVQRSPLATLLPTRKGKSVLVLDLGANVDIKASTLVQFAYLGSIYMQNYLGTTHLPRVGIVNIGSEEEKGNALVKESFPLLKRAGNLNFVGSVESGDILKGDVEVAVCEAFVGNAILKTIEGTAAFMMELIKQGFMRNFKSKLGALLAKSSIKKSFKLMDISEYGGAVMLGLNGLVVKAHGGSEHNEIKNAVLQCVDYSTKNIRQIIEDNIKNL